MKNLFISIIISALSLSLITGCKTGGLGLKLPGTGSSSSPVVADNILSMPDDASKVVLAISAKILNSDKKEQSVIFQSNNTLQFKNLTLFNFNNAILLKYNQTKRNLKAELFFSDTMGRTCAYSITALYTMNDDKIFVQQYSVTEIFMPAQNSVCFIFPTGNFKNLTKETLPTTFYGLYNYAGTRAITPKQASNYEKDTEWTIMVFALDRMSKSADMKLELSEKPGKDQKGYDAFSKYIIYSGWRVGILTGKFNLLEPTSEKSLYAKFIFNQGGFSNRSKLLGVYKLR